MEIKKIKRLPEVGEIIDREVINGMTTYYREIQKVIPRSKPELQTDRTLGDVYEIHYMAAEFFVHGWEESEGVEYVELICDGTEGLGGNGR